MPSSERSYPSVWARPRRRSRSTLDRERIVAEALHLLDTEGIEALSMRKLAAGLGVGTTSLYWHVANRDELIELVLNEVYAELEVPEAGETPDWRAASRRFARSMRLATLRHLWAVSVLDHMVAIHPGPNLTRATERMLEVFETAGFPLPEADRALNTVAAYMTGIAIAEAALHNWLARHEQTQEEWLDEAIDVAGETTEDYERVRTVVTGYRGKDFRRAMEEDFEYGLERVLDGLQTRLDEL